jgi:antitoxin VapB
MNAPVNARTFKSGNSEAVRLPKGMGFGIGTEVTIERSGHNLILKPVNDPAAEQARFLDMMERLRALPKPPYIEKREPIEFPDRESRS